MGPLLFVFFTGVFGIVNNQAQDQFLQPDSFVSLNEQSLARLYGCAAHGNLIQSKDYPAPTTTVAPTQLPPNGPPVAPPPVVPSGPVWQCYKDYSVPFSFTDGGDVQCLSLDGKRCLWDGPCNVKLQIAKFCVPLVPLVCGDPLKAVFGITGYDTPGHWCSEILKQCPSCIRKKRVDCSSGGAASCPADSDCVEDMPGVPGSTYSCKKRLVCDGSNCVNGFCEYKAADGTVTHTPPAPVNIPGQDAGQGPQGAPAQVTSRCIKYSLYNDQCGGLNLTESSDDYQICQPPLQCFLGPRMPAGSPGICRNAKCMAEYCFTNGQSSVDGYCDTNAQGQFYCARYRQENEQCGGPGSTDYPFCEPSRLTCKKGATGYVCKTSACLTTCTGTSCVDDGSDTDVCLPPYVPTTAAPTTTTTTPVPTTTTPAPPLPPPPPPAPAPRPRNTYGGQTTTTTRPPYYGFSQLAAAATPAPMCCIKAPPPPPKKLFLELGATAAPNCCPANTLCPNTGSVSCSLNAAINCASCVTTGLYTAPAPQAYY